MLTISLNEIKEHSPCRNGWKKLLGHLGKTKADDEKFPFSQILKSNGREGALWALRCLGDRVPARLLAVAFAQEVLHLMKDERSINAVKTAHLYIHGEATEEEYAAACDAACNAAGASARAATCDAARASARAAACDAARAAACDAARAAACNAAGASAGASARAAACDATWAAARAVARKKQAEWLMAIADNYEAARASARTAGDATARDSLTAALAAAHKKQAGLLRTIVDNHEAANGGEE